MIAKLLSIQYQREIKVKNKGAQCAFIDYIDYNNDSAVKHDASTISRSPTRLSSTI